MPRSGNELLGNGRATTKDVELFDGKSDSIEQRSGIQDARDNRETIKNSEQGSFLLPKSYLDYQGKNLGSGKAQGKKINYIISYQNLVMSYNRKEKELENSNPCEVFFLFCIYWLLTVLSNDGIL